MTKYNPPKTNRIDVDLKIPYPPLGRPKTATRETAHQNNNREYFTKNMAISCATEKELEDFFNMLKNVKRKTGHTRNDQLFMELLTKEDERLKMNKNKGGE